MNHLTISPNYNVGLEYSVPDSGFVEFWIKASAPVKSYVIKPKTRSSFLKGKTDFPYFGGFQDPRKKQHQGIRLPFRGKWMLLVVNESDKPVDLGYSVKLFVPITYASN